MPKMYCPICHAKMRETRGTHHKKRKWVCPQCGKVRFTFLKRKTIDK